MSYLWMIGLEMRLFSCGPTFEDYPQVFSQKKVQPLDFIFDTCASPLQVTFLVGEAGHVCLYPFARTTVFSAIKHVCFNLGARWHKILDFVPSCPICDDWPGDATFFPVGPTFEDHPHVFSQKRSSPLDFMFDPCALASWSHFLVGEGEHMCLYPFAKSCKESYPLN